MEKYLNGSFIECMDDIVSLNKLDEFNDILKENDFESLDDMFYNNVYIWYSNDMLESYWSNGIIIPDNETFFKFDDNKNSFMFFDYENFIAYMNDCYIVDNDNVYRIPFSVECNIYEINRDEIFDYMEECDIISSIESQNGFKDSLDNIDVKKPYIELNLYKSAFYTEKLYKQL